MPIQLEHEVLASERVAGPPLDARGGRALIARHVIRGEDRWWRAAQWATLVIVAGGLLLAVAMSRPAIALIAGLAWFWIARKTRDARERAADRRAARAAKLRHRELVAELTELRRAVAGSNPDRQPTDEMPAVAPKAAPRSQRKPHYKTPEIKTKGIEYPDIVKEDGRTPGGRLLARLGNLTR